MAKRDDGSYLRDLHRPAHERRTAEQWAAFLLPQLRAEMQLLDLGCGPGSITTGPGSAGDRPRPGADRVGTGSRG